jgi:hypothetical protein
LPDEIKTQLIGEKSEDFKIIFVDGMYTWLGNETGTITFFYDSLPDKMLREDGLLDVSTLKRIFPIEIRMRRSTYVSLIQFMIEQLKMIEEREKAQSENKKV